MALARQKVKDKIQRDLSRQLGQPKDTFQDPVSLRNQLGFTDYSLREWGKSLMRAGWYKGWFAPTEIVACNTVGDVIDLMFDTQTRTKEADRDVRVAFQFQNKCNTVLASLKLPASVTKPAKKAARMKTARKKARSGQ